MDANLQKQMRYSLRTVCETIDPVRADELYQVRTIAVKPSVLK